MTNVTAAMNRRGICIFLLPKHFLCVSSKRIHTITVLDPTCVPEIEGAKKA